MKVLVAHFTSECNEHISHTVGLDEFYLLYGDECLEAMHIRDIFEKADMELIPVIFASLHPNGMIKREAFDFVADKILTAVREHLGEINGIYLQFHGASGVAGTG